ncbi:MAG: DUF4190 domain-containing protein [Specibacter sp.]
MTRVPPSNHSGDNFAPPPSYSAMQASSQGVRPPLSKMAIYGFVICCVSVAIFGFMSIIGVVLCARGLRESRAGTARGAGLAIAGMVIGVLSFIFYVSHILMR